MEAPKCKICQLHHYGPCTVYREKGKIVHVVIPPQPGGVTGKRPKQVIVDDAVGGKVIGDITSADIKRLKGEKPKKKSSSKGKSPSATDGEAGARVAPAPAKPPNKIPVGTREAEVEISEPTFTVEQLEKDIGLKPGSIMESAQLHAILYRPDGTINEAAARAGHNAYMTLLMRKRRAKKVEAP